MQEDFKSLTHISSLLTNEELTEALSKWFKDTVIFTHWEYVGDTGKGDSYMSEVIRIIIHGKTKNGDPKHVQVILKSIPKSKSRRLTYRCAEFFGNEIKFYQVVLPALLEFQATKTLEDPFTNYPRLFLARSDGVEDFIALEDATLEQFGSVAVRQEGIDYKHCYVGDTGKGDSYMSEVIRIKIHGKTKNGDPKHVQVILKSIPKSKSRRLTYRCAEFFGNEIKFYQFVLPALLEFQATKTLEDPFTNYPKLFLARSDGVEDFIALEDATLEQFGSVAVRQEGIDYKHCVLSLKGLAKYHAMSFAMRDQHPDKFKEISEAIFETYYDERIWGWYERFWKRLCSIAIDAVEKEYPGTIYEKKIKEFAVPERYKAMIKAVKDTYSTGVISHGDCWTNNFMFKYENDIPVDVKLIDFQLARCGSPILDLSFMIYACTSQEMRLKHYDAFMKYYYEVLATQIRGMGSDPSKVYSWEAFQGELKKYSFFGLGFSMESTPFIVLAPEDAFNMEMAGDEIVNIDDIWQVGPFKTKEGRLREANNVVHCVDNGYI